MYYCMKRVCASRISLGGQFSFLLVRPGPRSAVEHKSSSKVEQWRSSNWHKGLLLCQLCFWTSPADFANLCRTPNKAECR